MFTKEEIWENYTYFIKKVVPVAEEAGVRIGIHPDDPPQPDAGRRAALHLLATSKATSGRMEIANSPNVGICLCCGTWLEGGKTDRQGPGGDDPLLRRRKKILKIHFRNVSAPLPHFVETFIDNGYYDMCKIMKALGDVNFDGIVIPDHIPAVGVIPGTEAGRQGGGGGRGTPGQFRPNVGLAYLLGCMHSMHKAALNHKSKRA